MLREYIYMHTNSYYLSAPIVGKCGFAKAQVFIVTP